jgi:hypothetical protein
MDELKTIEENRAVVEKRIKNYQKVLLSLKPIEEIRHGSVNLRKKSGDLSPIFRYRQQPMPNQNAYAAITAPRAQNYTVSGKRTHTTIRQRVQANSTRQN